ncbi:MAG TPA: iron donor protein CyaY [Terriglobia bacterium]|nr:iron donor protein CyaY [Terriglobia bacterium]
MKRNDTQHLAFPQEVKYKGIMALNETEFRTQSEAALVRLNKSLGIVAEEYDAEVMYQNGVLTVEVEEPNPGKMVISPNAPVRQIWISAQSRSFKLDWDGTRFVLPGTGESLDTLVGRLVGEQLNVKPFRF